MAILNNNWFNLNSTRRYPIDDSATGESDEGFDLPNDILVDIRLRFPRSLGKYASISSINCSSGIVSVTIIGHEYHPMVNNVSAAAETFSPLAVVSIPKPISPNVPYQVRALSDGVFGWIVFGEGVEKNFAARFSNADQALLSPKLAFSYGSGTVTSISVVNNDTKLYGDVVLRGVGDLKISREVRTYQGIGTVNGLVFTLENTSTNDNLFEKYKGKCQGRPESDSCKKTSVEYINDIYPDCDGNIDINFSQNGIKQEILINTIYKGYALELPLGLAEACTTDDYLPDPNGRLPNEYGDVCADVAASEGDPDAIAYTDNLINANPNFSSTVLNTSTLPYLDTMVLSPGSTTKPSNFEFINSNFAYEETVYYRGFPESLTTVGLAVRSSGSRFVGVWNDDSTNDHTYQSDVSTTKNGCRVSVTFAFKQLASLGSAGVIIDYTTVYVSSCDKYAKTYLLAMLDFSTKRLKLLNWTGFTWITIAQSSTIPNLSTGEWYSLDVQKDTSDTSGTKVKYNLRLYTAESYWTDLTVSSSLFTEVGSTPKSGYSVPISDNLITSLSAYAEPNDGLAGIGTVTGSPLFSYFFVG